MDAAVASESRRLGELYLFAGKPSAAEARFRTAVELCRKVYGGAEHPQTAYYLDRLAASLDAAGRRSEAEIARTNATAIRTRFRRAA